MKTKPLTFALSLPLIAGISLFIFILPQGIWADPSPGVKWLMDEPASLFDLGIRKLEKYVENKQLKYLDPYTPDGVASGPAGVKYGSRHVYYSYQKNKLVISIITAITTDDPYAGFNEDLCEKIVKHFRKVLLFEESFGEVGGRFRYGREASRKTLKKFFSHMGYTKQSRPMNLEDELVDITYVRVVQLTMGGKKRNEVKYEMPLAGGPISVTKKSS